MYGLLLAVFILKLVVISAQPTLTPQTVDVMENRSAILTCTAPSETEVSTFWQRGESASSWALIILDKGLCKTGEFLNEGMYLVSCHGNGIFTVTILKSDETQHNKTWRCRTGFSDLSNDVTVYVKVPVKSVNIIRPSSNSLMFREDKAYTFTCETTYSRPTPSIHWILQFAGNTNQINATSSDILTQNEYQFISLTNVLIISFGRKHNGGNLFCNGSNGLDVVVSSPKISLNVSFPPDGPPAITGAQYGSKYQIVEHEMARLSCAVSGGNPLAHIVWFCLNGAISEIRESNTVTSNITWTALRNQQNTPCICVAEHMFGNRNTFVTVDILYKASVLQFYIGEESTVKSSFTVNEKELVTFTCNIESKPPPNATLSYKGNILHVSVRKNRMEYTKKSIQCKDFGMYICSGGNKYNYGTPSVNNLTIYVNCFTTVSSYVANSSSTVAFVAVGVGTSVATLILGGSILFAYRFIRRRRKLLHNVHNVIHRHTETTEDKNEVAEYEQISMKSKEAKASISDNRDSVPVNESAQQYEKLDANRTERDQYSQLPALNEQIVITREEKEGGSVVSSETKHTFKDYVNIRI